MNPGTVYGRRQHQGRRPARTPAQQRLARRVGCGIVLATAAVICFGGGILVAGLSWLLGWYQEMTTPRRNRAMTATANGRRTTRTPGPDELPEPADTLEERNARGAATLIGKRPVGPELFCPPSSALTSPVTDALRAQGPPTEGLPTVSEPPPPHWADQLRAWWINTADADISKSLDKVVEYGGDGPAYDLLSTGHRLAKMNGRVGCTNEEAVELGIAFYISSKVDRWMAAIMDGRRPSDDTLLDITYYSMMARRNRTVGGWPVA